MFIITDLSVVVSFVDVGSLPEAQFGYPLIAVLGSHVQESHAQVVLVVYWHCPVRLHMKGCARRAHNMTINANSMRYRDTKLIP